MKVLQMEFWQSLIQIGFLFGIASSLIAVLIYLVVIGKSTKRKLLVVVGSLIVSLILAELFPLFYKISAGSDSKLPSLQLKAHYTGIYTDVLSTVSPMQFSVLSQDQQGNFLAEISIKENSLYFCKGKVHKDYAIYFSCNYKNLGIVIFTGKIFPDSHLEGRYSQPGGFISGNWGVSSQ